MQNGPLCGDDQATSGQLNNCREESRAEQSNRYGSMYICKPQREVVNLANDGKRAIRELLDSHRARRISSHGPI